jgi:transcriptional regulator with XRE-family HTH domain
MAKAKKSADAPKARHTLSGQIRDVIESRGLTLAELGKLADVDPTVIGRFLSGERDLRLATADKIAAALGLRLVEVASPKGRVRPSGPRK